MYAVFALAGAAFAAFASRLPEIKSILGLSAGELGVTLLAASLGSLLGLPAAGWLVHRFGAARTVGAGVIVGMLGILTIGLGVDVFHSRWVVTAGLWGVGLGVGSWDVAMNIEGAVVERHLGQAPQSGPDTDRGALFEQQVAGAHQRELPLEVRREPEVLAQQHLRRDQFAHTGRMQPDAAGRDLWTRGARRGTGEDRRVAG